MTLAVRYTLRAELDLIDIGEFTKQKWSEAQADRYIGMLDRCCERLAEHPLLGRACNNIRPGLRRMECQSHVVFYEAGEVEVVIARVLHKRMLPERMDLG